MTSAEVVEVQNEFLESARKENEEHQGIAEVTDCYIVIDFGQFTEMKRRQRSGNAEESDDELPSNPNHRQAEGKFICCSLTFVVIYCRVMT